jgi:hypothetical protein
MRPVRQGARPRRTHGGTVRTGNAAGGDAAALECRDLKEWTSGDRRLDTGRSGLVQYNLALFLSEC